MIKTILRLARTKILNSLSLGALKRMEDSQKNPDLQGYVQGIRLNKYASQLDISRISTKEKPICTIRNGLFDYPLFQICFLENMISLSVLCLANGYLPRIEFVNNEGINLWEQFCEQPCGEGRKESILCEDLNANFWIPYFPTKEDISLFYRVYSQLCRLNDKTKAYLASEFVSLLNGEEKVLGVLCRGTDYTANKPSGHPVQPSIDEVVSLCRDKMTEYGFKRIYLATEEKDFFSRFESEFPGKVITNQRQYFDSFYNLDNSKKQARISQVHFARDNDSYLKSLEYLSSLNILSKCAGLIAGSTGGSRFALIMNNNQYEYAHLFNKGLY